VSRRPSGKARGLASLPVLASVAALAALAVVMTQAAAFLVLLLAPEPRPSGYSLAAAAEALQGRPAETGDGRAVARRVVAEPIALSPEQEGDPLGATLRIALSQRLNVPLDSVRVRVERRRPPGSIFRERRPPPPQALEVVRERVSATANGAPEAVDSQTNVVVIQGRPGEGVAGWRMQRPTPGERPGEAQDEARNERRDDRPPPPHLFPGPRGAAMMVDTTTRQFTILADRVTFDPFAASLKLPDGRWATVEPPRDLIAPWQMRILLSMLLSMLVLAPIVWLLAQRITRPIRAFAEAAERLGADPDAEPLEARGPTEVRTAIAAFNEMQESLRGHIRRRTQTVAAIAHDLRTPLTRLRFRAEQAPDALRDRMAGDIEEMDALIGQAMAYVRGETPPERLEPLDLTALARACASGFAETGSKVSFTGRARLEVVGDPAGLKRAIGNLVDNALKFGGSARVSAAIVDGMAAVTVEDDGPGLDEAELTSVLEPFVRGEQSRNRETGGAGLGLAVARQAARASGGELMLENRAEGGLRARLSLPLRRKA
jgi:signal transduction histidine kinase